MYDPKTGTFAATGAMASGHMWGSYGRPLPVLPSGKVLIAGGLDGTGALPTTAELYDPTSRAFAATGSLAFGVIDWNPVVLADHTILYIGGWDSTTGAPPTPAFTYLGNGTDRAQRYDPSTESFTMTGGGLAQSRLYGCNVALADGGALAIGGWRYTSPLQSENNLERFADGHFTTVGTIAAPCGFWSFLLPNGKVLLDTGLLLDPSTGMTTPVTGVVSGWAPGYVQLANGDVLAFGGTLGGQPTAMAQVYSAASNSWSAVGNLVAPRSDNAAAILLPGGAVLLAGGTDEHGVPTATAEVYRP